MDSLIMPINGHVLHMRCLPKLLGPPYRLQSCLHFFPPTPTLDPTLSIHIKRSINEEIQRWHL